MSGTRVVSGWHFAGLFLLLVLAGPVPRTAFAAIVLQQPPNLPNPPAAVSSVVFNVQAFDDFSLPTNATVRSVVWWAQSGVPFTNTFSITFTTDPTTPASTFYAATVTATGTKVADFVTEFQANLPTLAALPGATNLWLSIFGTTPGVDFAWAQATGTASPGALPAGLSESRLANGSILLGALEPAWQLNDTLIAGLPVPSPEPGSLTLLAVGVGALAVGRRRVRGRA